MKDVAPLKAFAKLVAEDKSHALRSASKTAVLRNMLSNETTELTSQFPIPPPVKVKALENAKAIEVTDEVSQPDTFSSNFALLSNK